MTLKPLFVVFLALIGAVMFGCSVLPVQQMSDARQAIETAKAVGAQTYAGDLYQEALTLFEDAERLQSEGRYDTAAKVANRARKIAIKAREQALRVQSQPQSHEPAPSLP